MRIISSKRPIGVRESISILFALLFSVTAFAAPAATENEPLLQVLDQLGVRALLEQAPAVLAAATHSEAQSAAQANSRPDLEAQLKPQALLQQMTRYLREHCNADTVQQAQRRLQEPIAKRARYFDLAMTQPGAEKNLRDFLAHKSGHSDGAAGEGNAEERDSEARRSILREIDAASAASLLTATLQSAIAARVHQTVDDGAGDTALFKDAITERQRYLAPLAVDYLAYDYRYLRDDELRDYRDLLRDSAVQTVLEMSRQALLSALVGEITPPLKQPPDPRR